MRVFATESRKELLERVEIQARKIGITLESIQKAEIEGSDAALVDGKRLSEEEGAARDKLINRINEIGYDQVMEEVAYTWFNRFTALRFMEVNDYLPTRVRVLSSDDLNSAEPDMIKEALTLDLDVDKELIYNLKMENKTEKLFKYLIIKHCNDLNRYMPFMFETIDDYASILFPDGLLAVDSFVRRIANTEIIPEDSWRKVEIIGWLYQYYISEEKDLVFANLKKNIKITKDTLPAATQLFTPNWIVQYMVENSLGRIWAESYPDNHLKSHWSYYLDETEQDEKVMNQLEKLRYKNVNPEDITFLDPCCGSGHILVYAFDLFYDMYLEKGYIESDIPKLILEKNLFGLDIDDRAVQLSAFAVMMKAREKSRKLFAQEIYLNIYVVQESNWFTDEMIADVSKESNETYEMLHMIRNKFVDAKEYGSLVDIELCEFESTEERFKEYKAEDANLNELINKKIIKEKLPSLLKQAKIFSQRYDVVCTNPPYMGRTNMSPKLRQYIETHYDEVKADLYSTFLIRGFKWVKPIGFNTMVTMQTWMFLPSFKKMREFIIQNKTISTLLYMDNMVMGIAFGTSATVLRNYKIRDYKGNYTQIKYRDLNEIQEPEVFPNPKNLSNSVSLESFYKIPEWPLAYWMSEKATNHFNNKNIGDYINTREGMTTADNVRFLREWFEVNSRNINMEAGENLLDIGNKKWFPYQKGGPYRKWYGNHSMVVNWHKDGKEIKNNRDENTNRLRSHNYNGNYSFKSGITFSTVSLGEFGARFAPNGFLFDATGSMGFSDNKNDVWLVLALLNSAVSKYYFLALAPTIHFKLNKIMAIPAILEKEVELIKLTKECIAISKNDWNSFELSWDFKQHPLLKYQENANLIETAYGNWASHAESHFNQLKANEERSNRIFIENYSLQDELSPEVDEKNITIRKANLESDIKSFISYAIGCSFGRYSLDEEGLIYAGGEFDTTRYGRFKVDVDNILPILPDAYFEDDLVTRFAEFIRATFGGESLAENLGFVAEAIGRRQNETVGETLRRYFINDFYKDHVKIYKKRPIYWLFTSGKEKAFNCLIYMHRYDEATLSRIRTDYLHEYQVRLEAEKEDLLGIIDGNSTPKQMSDAKKNLKSLEKKMNELKAYDELLHHMADMQIEIDLDNGFSVNYEKFKGLVAKV